MARDRTKLVDKEKTKLVEKEKVELVEKELVDTRGRGGTYTLVDGKRIPSKE